MRPFTIIGILVILGIGLYVLTNAFRYMDDKNQEWYLACINNKTSQEYMLSVPHKPTIRDGLIWFDSDTFMPVPADSTCRRLPAKDVEKLNVTKKTSNII